MTNFMSKLSSKAGAFGLAILSSLGLASGEASASEIGYISSSSGYMLYSQSGQAVTANWAGQPAIRGFSGYGAIRQGGQCLTGRGPAGQALTWEACKNGDKSQVWALSNGRLNNEGGWCADVEGNRSGAGVRVVAWQCTGAVNQKWKAHPMVSSSQVAARMTDPKAKDLLQQNAARAQPGQLIDVRTGQLIGVDAGTLRAASAGQVMVTAGGGQLIAAGGLN